MNAVPTPVFQGRTITSAVVDGVPPLGLPVVLVVVACVHVDTTVAFGTDIVMESTFLSAVPSTFPFTRLHGNPAPLSEQPTATLTKTLVDNHATTTARVSLLVTAFASVYAFEAQEPTVVAMPCEE